MVMMTFFHIGQLIGLYGSSGPSKSTTLSGQTLDSGCFSIASGWKLRLEVAAPASELVRLATELVAEIEGSRAELGETAESAAFIMAKWMRS